MPLLRLLLIALFARAVHAAILEVPTRYSTIQAALDATQAGDTVRVAPGVYVEHLEGPMHAVSLFSQYPFTEDSSDIVDTVLDGNLSGTILQVRAPSPDSLVVNGFHFVLSPKSLQSGFDGGTGDPGGRDLSGALVQPPGSTGTSTAARFAAGWGASAAVAW